MKGNVISRDSNGFTIALYHNPEDACQACGLGDSCSLPKSESIHIDFNSQTKDLHINDTVEVEITPKKLIGLSALVYLLPLVFLFLGGLLGNKYSETMSILLALAGLSTGIILLLKLDKVLKMSHIISIRRLS